MIHLLREKATKQQIDNMSEVFTTFIKLAVDIERGILAGGSSQHADCEKVLLEDGSHQENIWGADWYPDSKEISYEALINIRPKQKNMSMIIQDDYIKDKIRKIINAIFFNE